MPNHANGVYSEQNVVGGHLSVIAAAGESTHGSNLAKNHQIHNCVIMELVVQPFDEWEVFGIVGVNTWKTGHECKDYSEEQLD